MRLWFFLLGVIPLMLFYSLFYPMSTATSQQPPQAEDTICPDDFGGYLPPRLTVGEQARVLPETPLNLRPAPTIDLARLAVVPTGTSFIVEDGPRCNAGYIWWQLTFEDITGWVAEGDHTEDIYWIEPRGTVITLTGADGIRRRYIETAGGFLEPEDCLRPPDDYTRVQQGLATLNTRTMFMLEHAQRIYNKGGGPVDFKQSITQGSYNPGGVSASFGTHDGGGAVDISVRSTADWSVLTTEIPYMLEALRIAGFAAWLRDTGDLYTNSPIHIHAIAVGDAEHSEAARAQINGQFGYLYGYDGLPREDGIPVIERHGGPVICKWMVDMGFDDLRTPEMLFTQGNVYFDREEYVHAVNTFTQAIDLVETQASPNAELYRARGDAYYALELPEEALADYRRYAQLIGDKADSDVLTRLEDLDTSTP